MALDYMRILHARGFDICRCGLNFKVVTSLGAVSYLNITQLAELAGGTKEITL